MCALNLQEIMTVQSTITSQHVKLKLKNTPKTVFVYSVSLCEERPVNIFITFLLSQLVVISLVW